MSLAERSDAAELMDTEAVPFDEFRECLRHLERINRASLAYRPTLAWLGRLVRRHPGRPLSILDVGFGHGDMLRRISGWAADRGVPVRDRTSVGEGKRGSVREDFGGRRLI